MKDFAKDLHVELLANQNRKKAQWLENYVKHDISSLGVGIPEIRKIITATVNHSGFNLMPLVEQELAISKLMKMNYAEDKLAAILYLQIF